MKDIYKREEKYQRTTQKLKQQVDGLMKEQTKLILKVKDQS